MSAPLKNASKALSNLSSSASAPRNELGQFVAQGKKASAWGGEFSGSMGGVITTLARVAAAVGVTKLALDSIKTAMSFDQQMANIASLGPEAKAARDDLHDLAIEMGMKTKYSALEAAESIENLVRAGRSVDQILGGDLEAAMSLAAADGMDLADAAMIMADTLNTFSREGLTGAQVADILAGASAAASTDVSGLRQGLAAVGSVAASVGLSLDDTTTALGLMANAGIKGSDAGTSLKTMLMRLQPTSKAASKMMKELGIITKDGANKFYDSNGQLKSMADISGILQDSMAGLTDQQRAVAMETMFGADAVRAANVLFAAGTEGVEDFQDAMSRTTALQMAADKMDSASGAAEILKGIMSTLQIVIGEALLPVIKDFCTWAANVATKIVEWFQSAEGQDVLSDLTDTVYAVIDAVASFCTWLGDQLSPLFNEVKTDAQNVIDTMTDWFASEDGQAWFDGLKSAVEGFIDAITTVYTFISDNWSLIGPIVYGIVGALVAFKVVMAAINIVLAVTAALTSPITLIVLAIAAIIAVIILLWQNWDQVAAWLQESWDAVAAYCTEVWDAVATYFTDLWASITTALTTAWDAVVAYLTGLWDSISTGVTAAWTAITTAITGAWDAIVLFFSGIDLAATGEAIFGTIGTGFTTAWTSITEWFGGLWGDITGAFDGLSLSDIGGNIIDGLWDGLKSAWSGVTEWFASLTDFIPNWVKDALGIHSPSRVMRVLGKYTMEGFALGLGDEQDNVESNAVAIANTPAQAVSATTRSLEDEAPTVAAGASTNGTADTRPVLQFMGDIILQNTNGDMRAAAQEFLEIVAEMIETDGDLVAA
jgi:TP901 family phage tail tape measure protein